MGPQMRGAQHELSHRIDLLPSERQETFNLLDLLPLRGLSEKASFLLTNIGSAQTASSCSSLVAWRYHRIKMPLGYSASEETQ